MSTATRSQAPARANNHGNGHAPAKPPETFLTLLDKSRGEFEKLLGDAAKVDRVLRICRTAYQLRPELRQCEPLSIIACAMKASELGLDPDGARKHAYLIPYKGVCTLQISYMGILELAFRSGHFRAIEARVVRKGDEFTQEFNPLPVFRHVPGTSAKDEDITHAYAYAQSTAGAMVIEVMSRAEIDKVKSCAQTGGVWGKWYGEMAKKTVIKRLLKRQRSSVEVAEAIEHDAADHDDARMLEAPRPRGLSRSADLANRLAPPPEPEDLSQEPDYDPAELSQEPVLAGSDDDNAGWDTAEGGSAG